MCRARFRGEHCGRTRGARAVERTGDLRKRRRLRAIRRSTRTSASSGRARALSQWALARYLVGRAITESVGAALLVVAAVLLVLAVARSGGALDRGPVLLVIIALGVLVLRWMLLASCAG